MRNEPTFRITDEDLDHLRDLGHESLIDVYKDWVNRDAELNALIRQIEDAFAGLTLGDGIGLLEASGLDDYAGDEELAELRARDEQTDWRRIPVETLNRNYSSPTFMDARGFIFHLPAFLRAELNDQYRYDFIRYLFYDPPYPEGWMDLLDTKQREAVAAVMTLINDHPNFEHDAVQIERAIDRLRTTM